MVEEFQINRKLLSSFYIASLFSFMIFSLMGNIITNWVRQLAVFLGGNFGSDLEVFPKFWLVFLFFCMFITLLLRRFIVKPLGFFNDEDGAPWWDLAIFAFLVMGYYIFMLNQTFSFAMPTEWFNVWWIRLFGGYQNSFAPNSNIPEEIASGWRFVRWFWYLGPLSWLYFRTKVQVKTD